jgi:hypothetical protein
MTVNYGILVRGKLTGFIKENKIANYLFFEFWANFWAWYVLIFDNSVSYEDKACDYNRFWFHL